MNRPTIEPVPCDRILRPFPAYPAATVAGGLLFLSGVRGLLADGASAGFDGMPDAGRAKCQGFPLADAMEGATSADAWAVHETMDRILQEAGSDGSQVLRQHIWQRDKRFFPCYERVRMHWQPEPAPSSGLGVARVAGPVRHWYGIDAIAAVPDRAGSFGRRQVLAAVDDKDLPSASHYSQAVRSGPLVFTAGHIAIRTSAPGMPLVDGFADIPPEGRFLATGRSHPDSRDGPIAAQSWFILNELRRTLAGQGVGLDAVVHTSVFLADPRDLATYHRVHRHFFPGSETGLAVIGFDEVGHRGCRIEIEMTALHPESGLKPERTPWPMPAPMACPAACRVGPLRFYSGMPGIDESGRIASDAAGIPEPFRARIRSLQEGERRRGLAAQCWWALRRLQQTATSAGASLDELAKLTVYLASDDDLGVFEAVRAMFVPAPRFAFEAVVTFAPVPAADAWVQVEAIGAPA